MDKICGEADNSKDLKKAIDSVPSSDEKRGDNCHPIASFPEMSLYEECAFQKDIAIERLKLLKCLLKQASGAADKLFYAMENQSGPPTEIYRMSEALQEKVEPLKNITADAKRIAFVYEHGTRFCEVQQVSKSIPLCGECRKTMQC